MAALPYRRYGGATRPDALNFNPGFNAALTALYANAPPDVQRELGLTSGYRDRATQERLFNASDRTGHSVARPGHSKHESGNAADLYGFGLSGGPSVSDATKAYVRANAEKHGLYFPMSYEPWHIQYRGDGSAPADGADLGSTVAAGVGGGGDNRLAALALQSSQTNPWAELASSLTDTASEQRGGIIGEGSAGVATGGVADPGTAPLETAALLSPELLAGQRPKPGPLASLFQVQDIGGPPPTAGFLG